MCGIVGCFGNSRKGIRGLADQLRHRGPDGFGFFESAEFSMGMARLAIQDSQNGQQPFASADGAIQVICNGEIYNWRELRKELEAKGHRFKTQCDTEVLPAGWQEWRTQLFGKLNGMFALTIYDTRKKELILARDQCGQKPLYYSRQNGLFVFASEIRALKAAGIPMSPNLSQLSTFFLNRYVSEPETLFKDVFTLPTGHWARVQETGAISVSRYWSPTYSHHSPQQSLPESLEEMDQVVSHAVRQTLHPEWKSALYLSSGVDSNMLAHYMREHGSNPVSLSLGFNSAQDETNAAQASAEEFGFEHHNILLGSESLEALPRVIGQMERPVGDALILAFDALAKGTKEVGAKLAFGAEGIDEHFGGYSFHKAYFQARRLGKLGRWGTAQFFSSAPQPLIDRLANFPASLGDEGKARVIRYLREFDTFPADWQADYLRFLYEPSDLQEVLTTEQLVPPKAKRNWEMNELLGRQYDSWLQDWSLIRQDKNTMAHSIEYRSPFLDPELISFAFAQPDKWKITSRQDKFIWRRLAEEKLPKSIAWRPKVPFYLPLEQEEWRKKLISMSRDVLTKQTLSHGLISMKEVDALQQAQDFLPLKKLASLLIFQLWYDQNF